MNGRRLGCHRRSGRWYCYTAADLLALLTMDPHGQVDTATAGAGELVALLAARGVVVMADAAGCVSISSAPLTADEARALEVLQGPRPPKNRAA